MRVLTVAAAGAMTMLAMAPAAAQPLAPAAPVALPRPERAALAAVAQAVAQRNWAAAVAGLPAAQSAARSPLARYALGRLQLDIGIGTNNRSLQEAALENILGSGQAPAADQPVLLRHQAQLAFDAGNTNRAAAILTRVTELAPTDPEAWAGLALLSRNRNNPAQAVTQLQRSVELAAARGRVPESRLKLGLALAAQARQRPAAMDFGRRLVALYPSAANWRDTLLTYRDLAQADPALSLDVLRLLRASGGLTGERDYTTTAQAFVAAGSAQEAKAVLDEGVTRGALAPTEGAVRGLIATTNTAATSERGRLAARITQARAGTNTRAAADAAYGAGRHADAAELYRLALARPGEDADLINLRLGAALAAAGQRAEAETALRAVTGTRADLAALWLVWLAQPAA